MLYNLIRPLLFLLNPETAHNCSLQAMALLQKIGALNWLIDNNVPSHPVKIAGITFPNPVGLAAGMDKNGIAIDALGALGFGFLELGTVTPQAQAGNPKPRLFRLKKEGAIINRMGFNNDGVDALVQRIQQSKFYQNGGIIGINIGKNAATPIENAVDDYLIGLKKAYQTAHYVAVNISSPNTKNLRSLQAGESLDILLKNLKATQQQLAEQCGKYTPIFIKIAPDLTDEEVENIAHNLIKHQMDGVIATNTTLNREKILSSPWKNEIGGLSGKPLKEKALNIQKTLAKSLDGALPIIGVGGIFSGEDAQEKIQNGAQLVQLYSGFVFKGPVFIAECRRALENLR